MSEAPSLKRRRVTRACESCRNLKAKCDGNHPICGRCAGYGYACHWRDGGQRKNLSQYDHTQLGFLSVDDEMQKLRDSIAVYDSLLRGLRDKLSETDRQTVNLGLASIQLSASNSTRAKGTTMIPSLTEQGMVKISQKSSSQRYLGEASDIRFFHDIELAYCHSPEPGRQQGRPEARIDSYEQERAPTQDPGDKSHVLLPDRASADRLVHIYFSTIHIAYPFISEPDFRQTYESFWQSDSLEGFRGPWLSLLLTVFAIGSCYERFAEPGAAHSTQAQTSDQHQRYFDHAVTIARNYASKHTVDHVSTLLAQCFYLLATCQTDRCWTTLGMGVRIAQSIGLHVEEGHRASCEDALAPREMCRRVWYSIFVLDRLLALQLGRPPAISEEGFYVNLPSKGSDVDLSNQNGQPSVNEKYWIGDYFLAMINFSTIIGRVFDKLYGPKKAADVALILSVIGRLDSEMLQWRSQLPRHLRFDLSHTFEKSMTFKRQRNMLAIKFYNLQALIHRSLLSPARLLESGPSSRPILHSEYGLISLSKRKCILAAQHTARLLHNIEDKKSLVYGFPWWQMISCLICASSILLVAGICVDLNLEGDVFSDIDWEAVDEDAEVCLTVFQALSSNSNAAKIARDMMQRLKKTRMISRGKVPNAPEQGLMNPVQSATDNSTNIMPSTEAFEPTMPSPFDTFGPGQDSFNLMFQTMPYEVSEPVMWSAQFVNAAYNPFLARSNTGYDGR